MFDDQDREHILLTIIAVVVFWYLHTSDIKDIHVFIILKWLLAGLLIASWLVNLFRHALFQILVIMAGREKATKDFNRLRKRGD